MSRSIHGTQPENRNDYVKLFNAIYDHGAFERRQVHDQRGKEK